MLEVAEQEKEVADRLLKRCKLAPDTLENAKQAYEAWNYLHRYQGPANNAYTKYMQASPFGNPQRSHCARWHAYQNVADEWESVLEAWLKSEAEKCGK